MRIHPRATAQRSFMNFGRVAFTGAHGDAGMVQEFQGGGISGESMQHIERPQNYGFSAVPMAADKDGSPEGHMFSHGGNPGHRIIGAVDDRRHRPLKVPEGASYQYAAGDIGTLVDPKGGCFMVAGGSGEKPEDQRASLRWAKKEKQPREFSQLPNYGSGGGGGQQAQGKDSKYQHEGENPTSELFAENDRLFGKASKSALHETDGGLYTLVDDKHVAIFASKELVAWVDKEAGKPFVTKPWEVKDYSHKKPSPSSSGKSGKGDSGGGGGGSGGSGTA